MRPFKAFIDQVQDTSKYLDITGIRDSPPGERVVAVKAIEFTLVSDCEFPWPPSSILGSHVVVMDADEYSRLVAGR